MVDYFKRLFRFRLVDRSLRPLLYAAGAAAIAAGIYYAYKTHQKPTREAGYTTIYQEKSAPMKVSSSDPNLKSLEDSLAEAQRTNEQAMEKITQLEVTNNFLLSKLIAVQQDLAERGVKCKELLRENQREQEARARLESQCKEVEETLQQRLKVCDKESEAYNILTVSLADAERKYSDAMESRAHLENEKTELMFQVNTLRGSVQQLEEELSEIRARCEILKLLLSQAEVNYDQAMLSNARLVSEKSDMMSKMNELEVSMQEMSNKLSEMHSKCVEATNEGV